MHATPNLHCSPDDTISSYILDSKSTKARIITNNGLYRHNGDTAACEKSLGWQMCCWGRGGTNNSPMHMTCIAEMHCLKITQIQIQIY